MHASDQSLSLLDGGPTLNRPLKTITLCILGAPKAKTTRSTDLKRMDKMTSYQDCFWLLNIHVGNMIAAKKSICFLKACRTKGLTKSAWFYFRLIHSYNAHSGKFYTGS